MNINTLSTPIGSQTLSDSNSGLMDSMKNSSTRFSSFMSEQLGLAKSANNPNTLDNVEGALIDMVEEMKVSNISSSFGNAKADYAVEQALKEISKKMKTIPEEVISELKSCAKDLCSPQTRISVNTVL